MTPLCKANSRSTADQKYFSKKETEVNLMKAATVVSNT